MRIGLIVERLRSSCKPTVYSGHSASYRQWDGTSSTGRLWGEGVVWADWGGGTSASCTVFISMGNGWSYNALHYH